MAPKECFAHVPAQRLEAKSPCVGIVRQNDKRRLNKAEQFITNRTFEGRFEILQPAGDFCSIGNPVIINNFYGDSIRG